MDKERKRETRIYITSEHPNARAVSQPPLRMPAGRASAVHNANTLSGHQFAVSGRESSSPIGSLITSCEQNHFQELLNGMHAEIATAGRYDQE